MVRHNNVIPNQHYHKDWAQRVKTWFHQPLQKKIRREKRKQKAAAMAPRPSSGSLRPVVHCPTQKYNTKVRFGRGFSLNELKEAGISAKYAATVGIAVDHRRTNKSVDAQTVNVNRLKEYKARLIVFPRKNGKVKKGDSSKAETAVARQLVGDIIAKPSNGSAVSFTKITPEMVAVQAHSTLRIARMEKKLVGKRIHAKKAKAEKEAGGK